MNTRSLSLKHRLLPLLLGSVVLFAPGCRTDASGPRIVEPVPVATDVADQVLDGHAPEREGEAVVIGLQADVQLDSSHYLEGAPIEVTVVAGDLGPEAWVGIFELDAPELSDSSRAIAVQAGVEAGNYTLEAPIAPGRYQVCLFDPSQETGLLAYREFEVEAVPASPSAPVAP